MATITLQKLTHMIENDPGKVQRVLERMNREDSGSSEEDIRFGQGLESVARSLGNLTKRAEDNNVGEDAHLEEMKTATRRLIELAEHYGATVRFEPNF